MLGGAVNIESRVAPIGRLGTEEEDGGKGQEGEDGHQVETPLPTEGVCDLANDDGGEESASEHGEIRECHADAALMNTVEVADGSIEQALKGRRANALKGAGRSKTVVEDFLLMSPPKAQLGGTEMPAGPSPDAGEYDEEDAEQEEMALAPDAARRNKEDGGATGAEQVVASQGGRVGNGGPVKGRDDKGVGGQYGSQSGGQDRGKAKGEGDEIPLP